MTNHKLRISIVELSKLIKVDTDILQYITSLESLIGMSDIDLQYGPLYFDVYIKEDVHLVLEYIYNTGVGIISMIDSGKLTNIMRSSDELEIIEAFNKELNANNLHKARKFKLKMEDDSYKKSLYLYVKDKLKILKHGTFNGSVNITNEMIDKQFEVYLKINTDEIQLILPFIPISNSIFKQDKYDLYTLVRSNVDSSLKFHRFFVDVYNRYGTKVNNEPVDLLMILCYGEYEIPTLDILERLTHNIEGYFVTINKRLVYNGARKIEKTDDPLFIDHIHVNPNVYMCLEKDVYGNYIVTNRQSHMSRSMSLCDTYIANRKDIKPYVFVTI
jgi:hypothetical protein